MHLNFYKHITKVNAAGWLQTKPPR